MNPLEQQEQQTIQSGHGSFFGAFAQQSPRAFLSFNRLLNAHNFDTIIEIGTHDGGLSTMFALYCYLSRKVARSDNPQEPVLYKNRTHHRKPKAFHTFDIVVRDKTAIQAIDHLGGQFERRDTLNDPASIAYIGDLITKGGSVLLLCDGGSKRRELELYAPFLKHGDFVMLHDWAYDKAAFESNKARGIWNGWETKWLTGAPPDDDFGIAHLCVQHGIKPVYASEFDLSAWFCGTKTQ